jgi:hypothetical protein
MPVRQVGRLSGERGNGGEYIRRISRVSRVSRVSLFWRGVEKNKERMGAGSVQDGIGQYIKRTFLRIISINRGEQETKRKLPKKKKSG